MKDEMRNTGLVVFANEAYLANQDGANRIANLYQSFVADSSQMKIIPGNAWSVITDELYSFDFPLIEEKKLYSGHLFQQGTAIGTYTFSPIGGVVLGTAVYASYEYSGSVGTGYTYAVALAITNPTEIVYFVSLNPDMWTSAQTNLVSTSIQSFLKEIAQ